MRGFPAPSSASPHAALCSQLILFQLPDVLAHRMFVHAHCLADGLDAEPALVGLLTFASPRETVHRQFACIESQEKPLIGQREKIPCPLCLLCLGVLTDGQALHEPLLEIVFVRNQHRFQDVVQKLQVLLPLDEIASGDAGEMQRSLRISMGSHSHSKL